MTEDTRSPKALYDAAASKWVRNEPVSLSDFTGRPAVLELCAPVGGARVLDLGCGEGYVARKLMRAGACEVVGVDLSGAMIDAARSEEARAPLGVRYEQGDATDLAGFGDRSFDLVVAVFLFNYLANDAMLTCMREVHRVLSPGGRFVFAVPHPAFPFVRRDKSPPFYFDVGATGYFEGRDVRFAGRIWRRDGVPLDVQFTHKTIEDYFTAMGAAGFATLPVVRELHATAELRAQDPTFFGPLGDAPLHLAMAIGR